MTHWCRPTEHANTLLVFLSVLVLFASEAAAQAPKSARTVLEGWDTNKNGRLEESEIPAAARGKFEVLAKRRGVDLVKGVPIDQLLKGDDLKPRKSARKLAKKSDKVQIAGDAKQKKSPELKLEPPSTPSKPSAKGFGDSRPLKETAGFRANKPNDATAAPSSEEAPPKKDGARGEAKESREQKRLRFLAKSMLAQHDINKSGRLEKKEWNRLRGNPATSDSNGDGILTVEELEGHLAGFAVREGEPRASRQRKPSKRSRGVSSQKTYRFLTPHERLPEGLPSWFTERDLNEDGQLSLREYASNLTRTELKSFRVFDLNNDGFVVAKEYLKSTE